MWDSALTEYCRVVVVVVAAVVAAVVVVVVVLVVVCALKFFSFLCFWLA